MSTEDLLTWGPVNGHDCFDGYYYHDDFMQFWSMRLEKGFWFAISDMCHREIPRHDRKTISSGMKMCTFLHTWETYHGNNLQPGREVHYIPWYVWENSRGNFCECHNNHAPDFYASSTCLSRYNTTGDDVDVVCGVCFANLGAKRWNHLYIGINNKVATCARVLHSS